MTKGQKIAVILTSIGISIVVGGLLYLYFNKTSILKKLQNGETVIYKMKEPKADHHSSNEYEMTLNKEANSDDRNAIILKQNGQIRGQYWIVDGKALYVTNKENLKTPILDSREEKLMTYLLSNV